ncbi:MAG: T9SS type A sorting domain-containing protein [Candidatus Zophobacter franzmannii]|nr:T9SS type A sorting domain-containing protein [Candidatus Zophobacter franzmannii]
MNKLITTIIAFVLILGLSAEIGDVLWEENFDNLDNWIIETGNGSWGWGNAELEYYSADNVDIAEIPGEEGNNGLRITARNEAGPNIVDQWGNPLNYTSGRLNTKSKISIQYGVIEARVLIPELNLGGWPAVWLLGTSNLGWPSCGEIDMMEMGAKQSFRNLHDTHNGGNSQDNSTVNQSVAANALFYSENSITPENPSGAASTSYDPNDVNCRPYYSYNPSLTGRFITYRAYWDDTSLRFTVIDNDVEYDLYEQELLFDESSTEFQDPFYLVTDLAIGGLFTDAFGLDGSGAPISMPLPAEMYVDYIKVMEWNDMGEVHVGPPEFQYESFGIFTDNTTTYNNFEVGVDAEIYVWEGTLSEGNIAPYEGDNGITWTTTGAGWFGAGIMSLQPTNLLNFGDGYLKFHIDIPAHISFQIGIIDAWGNQSYVNFPAHQTTYGLVRNGQWGQASIPVDDLRGELIDLRMLSYEFVILEVSGAQCEFAIDNIYWDGGTVSNDEETAEISNFELNQNYPNPFNPSTTISYNLNEKSFVEIEIYNLKGQKINTLLSDNRAKGNHSVEWDGKDQSKHHVSSGVYFYKLKVNDQSSMKKMILLK